MQESVFKEFIEQDVISDVHVLETLPSKGKPAQKKTGSKTVWTIKFSYGSEKASFLEAARGGPREWASLDNLMNWLKACGIKKCEINFLSDYDRVSQQAFEFANILAVKG